MADPRSVVPYHDPYDSFYINEHLMSFMSTPNPTLSDLTLNNGNVNQIDSSSVINKAPLTNNGSFLLSFPQSTDRVSEVDDPLDDPFLTSAFCEELGYNNAGNFSSSNAGNNFDGNNLEGFNHEGNNLDGTNFEGNNWQIENTDGVGGGGENSRPLATWPQEPVPFDCSSCQVLKQIVHTNGQEITRLEIHGSIGLISHAVLEIQPDSAACEAFQYQIIDFSNKSIEEVKQYMEQYCVERFQAGFTMMDDPLAQFYKALCVGLDWDENRYNNEFINPSPPPNPEPAKTEQSKISNLETEKKKTPLAAQRERTGKMTLKDIRKYFHMPIQEAAKMLDLSPTVLKKICRRGGLLRWPHRKIKAIEKKILAWKASMRASGNAQDMASAQVEIEMLEKDVEKICAGHENNRETTGK